MRSEEPTETSSGARSGLPEAGIGHPESAELTDRLEKAKKAILEEIRNYPRPIAGCDQQFNYLLEERDRIAGELSQLAALGSNGDRRDPRPGPG